MNSIAIKVSYHNGTNGIYAVNLDNRPFHHADGEQELRLKALEGLTTLVRPKDVVQVRWPGVTETRTMTGKEFKIFMQDTIRKEA